MSKKKMTVLDLCLCAMMIAMHVALELLPTTIRLGNDYKISLATLPFVVIGMLCGPIEGLVTGLLGSFMSQLLGPYGLMFTTPLWVIPGMLMGLTAGLVYKAFRRNKKVISIIITVLASVTVLVIFNLIASYLDGVVIEKYWTIEAVIALIPIRLVIGIITCAVYCAIMIPLCKTLQKMLPAGYRQKKASSK